MRIVVWWGDSTVEVWDAQTGDARIIYHFNEGYAFTTAGMALAPDGRSVLTASLWAKPSLWDNQTGRLLHVFIGHEEAVRSVAYAPDGKTILTGSDDDTARLWDIQTGNLLHILLAHEPINAKTADEARKADVFDLGYSPDGHTIFTVAGDGTLKIWDRETGKVLHTLQTESLAVYSPDSQSLLISARERGLAEVYDIYTGTRRYVLGNEGDAIISARYAPDGKTVAIGYYDGNIKLWNAETGSLLYTLDTDGRVTNISYAPDSQTIVATTDRGIVGMWDVGSATMLQSMRFSRSISNLVYAPDGKTFVTTDIDYKVVLWDATTGQPIRKVCPRVLRQFWTDASGFLIILVLGILGVRLFRVTNAVALGLCSPGSCAPLWPRGAEAQSSVLITQL